jgi:Na+/H+-dicarboxylate symporter
LDALDLFWHLANFVLPAIVVGALSAGLCKLIWRRALARSAWWTLAWQASAAGLAVLVAGLVVTGHDGRMITWAALVVACAVVPWSKASR